MSKFTAVAGIVVFLWTATAQAFPGPMMSLVEQYRRSGVVVVATAGKSVGIESTEVWGPNESTPMTVVRRIKGPADLPGEIHVGTSLRGGCPYDASFREGEMVLLFLRPWKPGPYYRTVDLGNSCLYVDAEGLVAYTHVLTELERIFALPEGAERDRQWRTFYFECVLHPATRREGFDGLSRWKHSGERGLLYPLSDWQRSQLAEAVVRERPPLDESYRLADSLTTIPHAGLDDYFVESLYHADETAWYEVLHTAISAVPERLAISVPYDLRVRWAENFERTSQARLYDDRDGQIRLRKERRALAEELISLVEAARRKER